MLSFITKGEKRKEETQLTPQWAKKLNLMEKINPISRWAKCANFKKVKELITDKIETILPRQTSPTKRLKKMASRTAHVA